MPISVGQRGLGNLLLLSENKCTALCIMSDIVKAEIRYFAVIMNAFPTEIELHGRQTGHLLLLDKLFNLKSLGKQFFFCKADQVSFDLQL